MSKYEILSRIYYDPKDSGSFGGIRRLLKRAHELGHNDIKPEDVKSFLQEQFSYTLHKPARRHFARNPTYVGGIDAQWQADLADMQELVKENDGYRYILTVIDIFSKYAWAQPVKDKGGKTIAEAMSKVFETDHRKPLKLQTDKGKEFFNKEVFSLLKHNEVELFASESDQKAAVVERFNRTLKTRLWTFFSARRTQRWVDELQNMVDSYNHSVHRTIGMAPASVTKADEDRLWVRLYGDGDRNNRPKTKAVPVGSQVRLNKWKGVFDKGYRPNWTTEHFKVTDTVAQRKRPLYKLEDYNGEEIKGTFYPEEVQHIKENKFFIERVLKRRTLKDGTKQLFVKWDGWPVKFNSWIDAESITQ